MDRSSSQLATEAYERLASSCVRFPAGVFQLGARLEDLPRSLRALDVRERLGLGALLAATPPRWIHLDAFALAARPVTNGDYRLFLEDPGYEDPLRWQRVFDEHPRGFLAAHVRSLLGEVAGELEPPVTVGALDAPRSDELAWVGALAARALGGSLPAEHRRDLGPLERDKLALLDQGGSAERDALSALDVVIGRLRDAHLRALREVGPERVDARFERALAQRDYLAPDLPVASLKLLDRLRAALARASDGARPGRIPLRRILYPLSWPSDDPRRCAGDAPDRWPWAERPVTGVSLHEALAYADWLTRASGERALVRLPGEAEHERAASWPLVERAPAGPSSGGPTSGGEGRVVVDRRWKRLFPWESRLPDDPGQSSPDEPPRSLARLSPDRDRDPFDGDVAGVRELIERTACVIGGGNGEGDGDAGGDGAARVGPRRLEMLLGFHWEWTRDRLSPLETEPCPDVPEVWEPGARAPLEVERLRPGSARSPWVAARGGPARLGGSPLATRRFGFAPLHGSPGVGFRLVVEPRGTVPAGRASP